MRRKGEKRMAAGTTVDAPIVAVTVFRDGARVLRTGTVNVEPGRGYLPPAGG
jgi:hypothetical protein